jgi:hypothetical protein
MSYTIKYLEDKKIVEVDVKQRVNFGIAQQYSKEALKIAHETDCNKFLINHTETLPEAGGYKIHTDGDTLEQFGFKNSDKVAIFISNDLYDENILKTTDSNVKWCDIKYFKNIEKAYLWLAEVEE